MARSPVLRAGHARWRAAVEGIAPARRLPDPVLSYTWFIREVETRVGPQRHRLGVQQRFPWPTELDAAANAQARRAQAAQRAFEADALELTARVADVYWRLWAVRARHRVALAQEGVLEALAGAVRGRVEVGERPVSDLLQVQLRLARIRDHRDAHRQDARRLSGALVAATGAPASTPTPTAEAPPPPALPGADSERLRAAAVTHPRVTAHAALAAAAEAEADHARAARLPDFGVGLDWIVTGEARAPNVPGSGDDAVTLSFQVSVPLWQGSYEDATAAARAAAAARRADGDAAARAAEAALVASLAGVADTHRRIALHRRDLIPRAEAVEEAVRGSYESGRATLAQVLLGTTELLELREALVDARAAHARAWATLDAVVGRPVAPRDAAAADDAAADLEDDDQHSEEDGHADVE